MAIMLADTAEEMQKMKKKNAKIVKITKSLLISLLIEFAQATATCTIFMHLQVVFCYKLCGYWLRNIFDIKLKIDIYWLKFCAFCLRFSFDG